MPDSRSLRSAYSFYEHPQAVAPANVFSTAAAIGASPALVRPDSTIALFDGSVPTTLDWNVAAAVGSAGVAARRDHTHGGLAYATKYSQRGSDLSLTSTSYVSAGMQVVSVGAENIPFQISIQTSSAASGLKLEWSSGSNFSCSGNYCGWTNGTLQSWYYNGGPATTIEMFSLSTSGLLYFLITGVLQPTTSQTITLYAGLNNGSTSTPIYQRSLIVAQHYGINE